MCGLVAYPTFYLLLFRPNRALKIGLAAANWNASDVCKWNARNKASNRLNHPIRLVSKELACQKCFPWAILEWKHIHVPPASICLVSGVCHSEGGFRNSVESLCRPHLNRPDGVEAISFELPFHSQKQEKVWWSQVRAGNVSTSNFASNCHTIIVMVRFPMPRNGVDSSDWKFALLTDNDNG